MGLESGFGEGFLTTRIDALTNWGRASAVWPMPMGLACCAIEMMAFAGPRYDASRFGAEVFRFSPRQADLMIVAGWCSYKMAAVVKRVWDQMPDPKWCIAMGACASSGGPHRSYGVVQGVDQFLPVDVYVAGCPPRPDNLINALLMIQDKITNTHSVLHDARPEAHVRPLGGAPGGEVVPSGRLVRPLGDLVTLQS